MKLYKELRNKYDDLGRMFGSLTAKNHEIEKRNSVLETEKEETEKKYRKLLMMVRKFLILI